jgi:hypothetical protein
MTTNDRMVACKTKEEADALIAELVDEELECHPSLVREQARTVVMKCLGYFTGYLDRSEAGRLLELFGTRHPYFGAIEEWPQTPEEMIAIGMKVAKQERGV